MALESQAIVIVAVNHYEVAPVGGQPTGSKRYERPTFLSVR